MTSLKNIYYIEIQWLETELQKIEPPKDLRQSITDLINKIKERPQLVSTIQHDKQKEQTEIEKLVQYLKSSNTPQEIKGVISKMPSLQENWEISGTVLQIKHSQSSLIM